MRKTIHNYFRFLVILVVGTATFTACADDESPVDSDNIVGIFTTITTDGTPTTRAAAAYAPAGGKLTLCYGSMAADAAQRVEYAYAEGVWGVSGKPLYWNDLNAINSVYPFFAAAPAMPNATPAVAADQDAEGAYLAADQLLAYATVDKRRATVPLEFSHVLSQLTVKIESNVTTDADDYIDPTTAVSITLSKAHTGYSLNYDAATVAAPAVATTNTETAAELVTLKKSDATFYGILPPQQFAEAGGLTLTVTIGGLTYTWKNTDQIDLAAGTNHQLVLKVKKSSIVVEGTGVTLVPWDNTPTPISGILSIDIIGTPDSPPEGTEAYSFTTMKLWKNNETALTYEKGATAWALSAADIAQGRRPFYLDDLTTTDVFYATADNSDADAATGLKDIVVSGPASVKGGQLVLTFQHLLAQLVVELKTSKDFSKEISIAGATITLPEMVNECTLTGIALTIDAAKQGSYAAQPFTDNITAPLLVVPQTLAADAKLKVTLPDKRIYIATVPAEGWKLEAGKKNKLVLTLTPTQPTLSLAVESWATIDAGAQTVHIDGIGDAASGNSYTAASGDELQLAGGSVSATYLYDTEKSSWNTSTPIYWDSFSPTTQHTFSILVTPKANAPVGGGMKDILYSSLTTAFGAPLNFTGNNALKHAMSQFELTINRGTGFAESEPFAITAVQMKGVKSATTIANDGKGTPTLSVAPVEIIPIKTADKLVYTVMVAPQPLTVDAALVTFAVDGKPFTVKVPTVLTAFTAGKLHQFTATVNKSGLSTSFSLVEWVPDDLGDGDINIDK